MQIYRVGGSVRDELLGIPSVETDWVVVGATPEEMLTRGFKLVGKDFPVFLHPQTHEEYALARTERKSGPGHKGFICYSAPDVSLEQDLARRDLTINAIAMDDNGELIDPYHGQQDLQQKVLRHVTSAFTEDPLRVYRVARFYAKLKHLGFSIAPETYQLITNMVRSGELATLSHERIWQETLKALNTPSPSAYFELLKAIGALSLHFPHISTDAIKQLALIQQRATPSIPVLWGCITYEGEIKLHVPKPYQQLQQLAMQQHQALVDLFQKDAADVLTLLKRTDALRRTERFEQLTQACLLIHNKDLQCLAQYRELVGTLKNLDIADLIQQFQNQTLAAAIMQRQIDTIELMLLRLQTP